MICKRVYKRVCCVISGRVCVRGCVVISRCVVRRGVSVGTIGCSLGRAEHSLVQSLLQDMVRGCVVLLECVCVGGVYV